ncbi:MAG: protein kinase [Pseudomonadota bacterium]
MQRKEVIDLRQYRAASHVGSDDIDGLDDCALRTGTQLLHGQYTLTEFLAAGGFGMTYVARDSLSRTVVIKECFPTELCVRAGTGVTARSAAYADGYQTLLDQFVAEAHCLAQLKHRNIVHVHQVFKENGTAYMAMDYVDGVDLCQIIDARARQALPPKEIVRIALRILHAIRYVHDSGMLHLDISPDNILIDRKGEPVLIDFGAARTGAASAETAWPLGCVKDGYSPPEFYIPHRERGAWSDLYSLGASLYHLMSGEAPPSGEARGEHLADGSRDPYQPLDVPGYTPTFLKSIDRALQFDPLRRMQSAEDWIKLIDDSAPVDKKASARKASRLPPARPMRDPVVVEPKMRDVFAGPVTPEPSPTVRPVAYGVIGAAVAVGLGLAGSLMIIQLGAPEAEVKAAAPVETAPIAVAAPEIETTANADVAPVAEPASASAVAGLSEIDAQILRALAALDSQTATLNASDMLIDITRPSPVAPGTVAEVAMIAPVQVDERMAPAPQIAPVDPVPTAAAMPLPAIAPVPVETALLAAAPVEQARVPVLTSITRPGRIGSVPSFGLLRPDAAPEAVATVSPVAPPKASIADPIAFAHWDVEMPFTARVEQVRNATIATITEVDSNADLTTSGAWIREDTVIYALNGTPLMPETGLSGLLLTDLQTDPDGFTRASVQYLDPDLGVIDRGLLAARVVRRVGLVDGTELDLSVRDLVWQARVRTVGTARGNTLREGDVIVQASVVGAQIESFEDLEAALQRTIDLGATSVELQVQRNGQIVSARLPLAKGDAS